MQRTLNKYPMGASIVTLEKISHFLVPHFKEKKNLLVFISGEKEKETSGEKAKVQTIWLGRELTL